MQHYLQMGTYILTFIRINLIYVNLLIMRLTFTYFSLRLKQAYLKDCFFLPINTPDNPSPITITSQYLIT
ncbi:hypothetical protein AN2V17_13750 [Vallitalea sp. AN17-2]|uniref:Uncharacterized protein n=1 Tax=Vallitalea maricola TaxID=3074433 RepID=A0ACB5UHW2_9FIRM|nr:hypothetical protein AN2V17_13750 [Vallitalea sp. AN17-2]